MLRVQTTISVGEHYVERVLEVDDISSLSVEERATILDGAISAVYIDHEETGPDDVSLNGKEDELQSGTRSTVGDIKVKVDMDTSGIEAALEEVRQMLTRLLSDYITVVIGDGEGS